MCMNYLYISVLLCAFSMVVTIVVSLFTPPPTKVQLKGNCLRPIDSFPLVILFVLSDMRIALIVSRSHV